MSILNRIFKKKIDQSRREQLADRESLAKLILVSTEPRRSLGEIQQILEQHPELLAKDAEIVLDQLITVVRQRSESDRLEKLEQFQSLLKRCREVGVEEALIEVADTSDVIIPSRFRFDIELIAQITQLSELRGRSDLQDQIIAAWRNILNHPDFASSPLPFRADVLNGAGTDYLMRYRSKGTLEDLDTALSLMQQALKLAAPKSIESIPILNNLGLGFSDRYSHTGELVSLEQAIGYYEQAAQLIPTASPDRILILNNLGDGLRLLYIHTGNVADLDRSVQVCSQAVELTEQDSPRRASPLNNRGLSLRERYDRTGNLDDLRQAIESWQEALKLVPRSSSDRVSFLANLALGLSNRYARTGNVEDLEQAIDYRQEVLELTSKTSPYRPWRLNNLATSLHDRYKHFGAVADLNRALEFWDEAAEILPPSSPQRTVILGNLAAGFRSRFSHTRDLADLTHALKLWEQITAQESTASPKQLSVVYGKGLALRDHYLHTGDRDSLEKAIQIFQEATNIGLKSNWDVALASSLNWGEWAMERTSWEESATAFGYGLKAIEYLFRTQRSRLSKETWLQVAQGLPANAAYALARSGNFRSAALALETGQARLLSEALTRNQLDLAQLEATHPQLARQYREASDRISALQSREESTLGASSASLNLSAQIAAAYREVETAIQKIQRIEGYEHFLDEPKFEDLANAVQIQQPLVYLITTKAGSLALVAHRNSSDTEITIEPVWVDSFSTADLHELLDSHEKGKVRTGYLVSQFRGDLETELDKTLPTLGQKLIAPIAHHLRLMGNTGLVLIPNGLLGLLPLHAATYPARNKKLTLLDEFDVSYVPTAQVLTAAQRKATTQRDLPPVLTGVGNPLPNLRPLRYARLELERVATLFSDNGGRLLYEREATKEALLACLPGATYVHFSCHGMFDPKEPLNSHLQLADGQPFTVREILECRELKNVRLAVLSACQTAVTDFSHLRDEVIGLPASFFQAGVRGVVGSLWPVSDLATMLLMIRFYEYHLKGDAVTGKGPLAPDKALRAALLWLRDVTNAELTEQLKAYKQTEETVPRDFYLSNASTKELSHEDTPIDSQARPFAHPYYWAAFAFYGR